MTRPYILRKNRAQLADLKDGLAALGLGVGNVYYVIKQGASYYSQFVDTYSVDYNDGTNSICPDVGDTTNTEAGALKNTGIQDALDKCVAGRNDYVIVMPHNDDYDLGKTLTMSKRAVHLICPAGLGRVCGAANAARLHPLTAAAVITVSANNCEIAGLWFKNYPAINTITLSNDAAVGNIHHNTFPLYMTTGALDSIIDDASGYFGWGKISNNFFATYSGEPGTWSSIINIVGASSCVEVSGNIIIIGDGCTATVGISNGSYKGITNDNYVGACPASGGSLAGTVTTAIAYDAGGFAINNRLAVANTADLSGGGTNTAQNNISGGSGGAISG